MRIILKSPIKSKENLLNLSFEILKFVKIITDWLISLHSFSANWADVSLIEIEDPTKVVRLISKIRLACSNCSDWKEFQPG